MRLYHFLPAQYALDDLARGRLKLSEIESLNDPFELWCSGQGEAGARIALRRWKKQMARQFGLLCFCGTWRNPLLWSHYGDRHKGIALGFDVRDDSVAEVKYVGTRTPLRLPITEPEMLRILFTKYSGWSYEEEWRGWFRLEERDAASKLFFKEFDDSVALKEVIIGPLCTVTAKELGNATGRYASPPKVVKARLAFNSFEVVQDQRGF